MDTFERIIVELLRIAPRCEIEGQTAARYEERWRAELRQLKRELDDIRCRALVPYNRPTSLVPVERVVQWSRQWFEQNYLIFYCYTARSQLKPEDRFQQYWYPGTYCMRRGLHEQSVYYSFAMFQNVIV